MVVAGLYGPLPSDDLRALEPYFRAIAPRLKYFARELSDWKVAFVDMPTAKKWLTELLNAMLSDGTATPGGRYTYITDDGAFLRHGDAVIDIEED